MSWPTKTHVRSIFAALGPGRQDQTGTLVLRRSLFPDNQCGKAYTFAPGGARISAAVEAVSRALALWQSVGPAGRLIMYEIEIRLGTVQYVGRRVVFSIPISIIPGVGNASRSRTEPATGLGILRTAYCSLCKAYSVKFVLCSVLCDITLPWTHFGLSVVAPHRSRSAYRI